jgi:hypothetical protein
MSFVGSLVLLVTIQINLIMFLSFCEIALSVTSHAYLKMPQMHHSDG